MYAEYYGFRTEPFLLTPDHRFFFESSVHSQAMAYLTYGITRGEGFIVITGEIGAGKTTLVQHLCATLDKEHILTAHVVTTQLDGADLLRMVASAFGLEEVPEDKSSILLRLQNFFTAALKSNCRVLLIVDEAQNLPASSLEELRMLSNFQVGSVAPFQSFLIGQPQFRTILSNPNLEQLRQRIIASYHLGPMNAEECGKYLEHRLQTVGWTSDPSFDTSALEAIYDRTGGVPRRINTLCNRILLLGMLDNLHHFSAKEVNRVASDLAAELPNGKVNHKTSSELVLESAGANVAGLPDRLLRLEYRVARHEAFIRQAASTLRSFLQFSQHDPE
jgi:general secretion pathway protein A